MDKILKQEISNIEKLIGKKLEDFNRVDWYCISINQKLSEKFIEKYKDEVFWYYISRHQKLSEDFIERYQNKVKWGCISEFQELSQDFREKYAHLL